MKTHLYLYAILVTLLIGNALSAQDTLRKYVVEFPGLLALGSGTLDFANENSMPQFGRLLSGGIAFAVYPNREIPAGIEVRGSLGGYARGSETRTFNFQGTPNTNIDIDYFSRMHKLLIGAKFANPSSDRLLRPFAALHAGRVFFRSSIYILDPEDDDACLPLEDRVVHGFNGWAYGGEAGMEVMVMQDMYGHGEDLIFYVSGSLLCSFRDVEYINVDYLLDEVPVPATDGSSHQHGQGASGSRAHEDVFAGFIDVSSQTVHYHKIAELYRTRLQLVGLNVGLILRF